MPALQLLIVDFVVAGFAAGAAVVEAVFPEADIELSLAKTAVFIALAAFFNLFALAATGLGLGRHRETLALWGRAGNVPLVTWNRGQALGFGHAGPMLRSGMNGIEHAQGRFSTAFGHRLTALGWQRFEADQWRAQSVEVSSPRLTPQKTA
jgi:hypothetical protein